MHMISDQSRHGGGSEDKQMLVMSPSTPEIWLMSPIHLSKVYSQGGGLIP